MGQLERADELLRKGKYAQAIEILRELLSNEPDNADLRGRTGEAYRLSGNAERAFHHFNRSAAMFQKRNDIVGACRMLKAANSVSPNEPDILFRMAECLKTMGAGGELEAVLRQLIQVARGVGDRRRLWALEELCVVRPDDLDLAVHRASALGEAGRIDDAVTAWKRVSAHLEVIGVDYVPMLRNAAQIGAERPDVGVDLADILLIARRPKEALALLVPFYEKFPEDIGVLGALVKALEQLGAKDKVVPARIELIKARVKRGHRELAFQEVSRLMDLAGDDPLAIEVSAHTYNTFGFRGDASQLWRRLVQVHDDAGRAVERDRAVLMLLKTSPDDPDALGLASRCLRDAGRTIEADALDKRLVEVRKSKAHGSIPAVATSGGYSMPDRPTDVPPPPLSGRFVVPRDLSAPTRTHDRSDDSSGFSEPEILRPRLESSTRELREEDLFDLGSDYPSDAFAPDDEPPELRMEPMPIAKNPYAAGLDLREPSSRSQPLWPQPADADPDLVPTSATEAYREPDDERFEAEEITSRMIADEIAELRQAFSEEAATHHDIERDEDPTLPPPDDYFEEFTARTRSQLIADLVKETSQSDDP
jgi:tetratricopeptide (TPR) repeat protein